MARGFYLATILTEVFTQQFIFHLVVSGDAAATAANICCTNRSFALGSRSTWSNWCARTITMTTLMYDLRVLFSLCDLQLFSWFAKRFSFVASRGTRFVDVGWRCRGEFEQVTRLAPQCRTYGIERGETDGACLSCFENRQVGERDSDSPGQLAQRHAAIVKHVVQFDDDRHWSHRPFEFFAHAGALLEHVRQHE